MKGAPAIIVVTEQNEVLALDASTGKPLWTRTLGAPVKRSDLRCGNIDPLGIAGTPVQDAAAHRLYVAGMVTPDGGKTKQHFIFALSLNDGSVIAGWPVEAAVLARRANLPFETTVQNQRGALLLLGGNLYVPCGGAYGDCGDYHGFIVGVATDAPRTAHLWRTRGKGGGVWAPGGISSDGGGDAGDLGRARRFTTPLFAQGRVFVAADGRVTAFATH